MNHERHENHEKKEKLLVPRLRFPEFWEAGEWTSKKMSDVYRFLSTNTYSRDKLNYEKGEVKNIHYGDIHTKFSTLFNVTQEYVPYINKTESLERIKDDSYCFESDIVFADASEDAEDVGKSIEIVHTGNEKILSGLHTLLARQKNNDLVIGFGGYLFKSGLIREQIKRESQGAKVLGISSGRLSKIKVCFPSEKREQQKIADCLSSLDALIAAQAEKLDALKTHKKGLMQQLFPRAGETVPRLRFPEFRNAEEWEEKPLSECCHLQAGKFVRAKDIHEIATADMYPCYGGNGLRGFTKTFTHFGQYPLIGRQGAQCGNVNLAGGRFHATEHAVVATANQGVNAIWLFYKLIKMNLNQYATGQAQPGLSVENLDKLIINIPEFKEEQQKIADCLSSLDALIAAQAEKIDALKQHKKGLMQQLFPGPEAI